MLLVHSFPASTFTVDPNNPQRPSLLSSLSILRHQPTLPNPILLHAVCILCSSSHSKLRRDSRTTHSQASSRTFAFINMKVASLWRSSIVPTDWYNKTFYGLKGIGNGAIRICCNFSRLGIQTLQAPLRHGRLLRLLHCFNYSKPRYAPLWCLPHAIPSPLNSP